MMKPLLFLFFFFASLSVQARPANALPLVAAHIDDEYDRYKKKGDDLFRVGNYAEAVKQYRNCLEVPTFENDAYAKGQIERCTNALNLRQKADSTLQKGDEKSAMPLFNQLLSLNADDGITKATLVDYYEQKANRLYGDKWFPEAKGQYENALRYATNPTKRSTLELQIRNSEENTISKVITDTEVARPSKRIGLKLLTGAVAIGAGAYAMVLRTDYQAKLNKLNEVGRTVDPDNDGIINTPDAYRQYASAYADAEVAQRKNGLYKACLGIAATAVLLETYLLIRKPKVRETALQVNPSSHSWGVAVRYSF
ncbi:hypothetical protein [Spirosoma montaniterrae]|uniref:Tetratricopeptide repeat protein n=1 Tax=Spirosoma montaniterrae TaxID=1178516 RepID=A0A1P9X3E8_9BACT|nr:hypothetical protein [Spirosoma montaniterrae]AQG82154.1 hypothetical protein AWR27_24380 [Spirosoma montaniterrae]